MSELSQKTCIPCSGGVPALSSAEQQALLVQLGAEWQIDHGHHLEKTFRFPDFLEALAFTNRVGALAEEQAHHPDLLLAWGRVRVSIWTHKIDGLTESDFILAAKIDEL